MLRIYGTMLCKDCIACCQCLDKAGVPYVFLDFSEDLQNLKDFLKIRDQDSQFQQVKEAGKIGIPCILDDEGNVSLTWEEYVSQDDA